MKPMHEMTDEEIVTALQPRVSMSTEEARSHLERLRGSIGDSEAAHGIEDWLKDEILEAIANGAENYRELAAIGVEAGALDYDRWYA
jgi:hypothetical protein